MIEKLRTGVCANKRDLDILTQTLDSQYTIEDMIYNISVESEKIRTERNRVLSKLRERAFDNVDYKDGDTIYVDEITGEVFIERLIKHQPNQTATDNPADEQIATAEHQQPGTDPNPLLFIAIVLSILLNLLLSFLYLSVK